MMAKGGNSQKSNGSRFTKPYSVSNSFVTKVASRVSDYLGGWFGTPLKSSTDDEPAERTSTAISEDSTSRRVLESIHGKRSLMLSHSCFDEAMSSPSKRFKISEREKVDISFPISPIPSTSGLFQSTINHTFDIPKSEEMTSDPGPSSLQPQRYLQTNNIVPPASSTASDIKANGATDNHSDSSESTSGCSSLVPQSDRLSQSAYVSSSRKRTLEEKLKYARQLQQSRASIYLNRSVPVSEVPGVRKKPSFDVTAYGASSLDKSLLREKLINSPFYTGQTSYGGASAYRLSRNTFYSQKIPKIVTDKREVTQVQVKPSHHGSTEELSNMSHTAKKILEALEQFSTPVNDAKRIPVNRLNVPLALKRRRFEDGSEARMKLSTPVSPLNPNPGPVITGLNVPTVPDLLKLKRLERIQNSTAAARQVAVQKQEYTLPSDVQPKRNTGKIVRKMKDKKEEVLMEKLEEVNLPKIPLPITTLPKFDFQLPTMPKPDVKSQEKTMEQTTSRSFKFSPPIPVSVEGIPERGSAKNSFRFSDPLRADGKKTESQPQLSTFMSSDAIAKLKRKSINDTGVKSPPPASNEVKTNSFTDFLNKNKIEKEKETETPSLNVIKPASGTWECGSCLIRNLNDSKICCGCKVAKVTEEKEKPRTLPEPPKAESPPKETKSTPTLGFGDKFKPPTGSWSCKECFVNNNASATKCIACETPKNSQSAPPPLVQQPPTELPKPEPPKIVYDKNGFGDLFKKKANEWECSVCMIRNKENDTKCVACETPKPGSKPEKLEPKFNFGIPPVTGGFKFGIDKADVNSTGVKSVADSSSFKFQTNGPQSTSKLPPPGNPIVTSVGVFTFGIPPTPAQDKKEEAEKPEPAKTAPEVSSGNFMVTSTSESSLRKEESVPEKPEEKKDVPKVSESKTDTNEASVSDLPRTVSEPSKPFFFGAQNKSPIKPFFGTTATSAPTETADDKSKALEPKTKSLFFGGNSNSLEAVSSSTTDFAFGQVGKPATTQQTAPDAGLPKPAATFQFKPFGSTESTVSKPITTASDTSKVETKVSLVSTSAAVTTAPSLFAPTSMFSDSSKATFGTTSTSSGLGFGSSNTVIATTTSSTLFSSSAQPFTSSGFNAQPSLAPSSNAFRITASSVEKPAINTTTPFGSTSTGFGTAPNPFASTAVLPQNQEVPKTFGNLPGFGSNLTSTPAPAFGTGFMQPTTTSEKPAATPFIFGGSSVPAAPSTSAPAPAPAPAPASTSSGVFTFGASEPEVKPFTFGQSATSNFSFGTNSTTNNAFGGFGQTKTDNPMGSSNTLFGNPMPTMFGQSSAPAAFESSAPKFKFGAPAAQQQETTPSVFQFGATPAQPASAPAGAGFSLAVPQKFNFTVGQTPVFSAETPSTIRKNRKVIKAVRRTNVPRRPN